MKFRVEVICVNDEGTEQRRAVMEMEQQQLVMETLGLSLAEGKAALRGVQDFVASQQISEDLKRRRRCPNCGEWRHSQAAGTSTVETVFGPVAVPNPRWQRCPCQTEGPKTFRPTATWLKGRTSPERLYLETKWSSLMLTGRHSRNPVGRFNLPCRARSRISRCSCRLTSSIALLRRMKEPSAANRRAAF